MSVTVVYCETFSGGFLKMKCFIFYSGTCWVTLGSSCGPPECEVKRSMLSLFGLHAHNDPQWRPVTRLRVSGSRPAASSGGEDEVRWVTVRAGEVDVDLLMGDAVSSGVT